MAPCLVSRFALVGGEPCVGRAIRRGSRQEVCEPTEAHDRVDIRHRGCVPVFLLALVPIADASIASIPLATSRPSSV